MKKDLSRMMAELASLTMTLAANNPNDADLGKAVRKVVNQKLKEHTNGVEDIQKGSK